MLVTHHLFFQTMRLGTLEQLYEAHSKPILSSKYGTFNEKSLQHLAVNYFLKYFILGVWVGSEYASEIDLEKSNIFVVCRFIRVRSKCFKSFATSFLIYISINTESCRGVARTPANIKDGELCNNS